MPISYCQDSFLLLVFSDDLSGSKRAAGTFQSPMDQARQCKQRGRLGIRNGIVVSLWPAPLENQRPGATGGPRGLLRIGYEYQGIIYHINYIAVEPVVDGKMEFSEISPSRADGKWGKLFWASDTSVSSGFFPSALCRGKISLPDAAHGLHRAGKGNDLQICHARASWIELKIAMPIRLNLKELFAYTIEFTEIRLDVVHCCMPV